jgi:hypothetical protein
MLEQALRTFLLTKTAITGLVGQRIHVGDFVPLADADMPALGIEGEAAGSQQCLDASPISLQFPTFVIRAKGRLFLDSCNIIDQVVAACLGVPLGMVVTITVNSAPVNVTIVQVDLLSEPYNEEEVDYGHAYTIKPRAVKIRVGWRRPVTTI